LNHTGEKFIDLDLLNLYFSKSPLAKQILSSSLITEKHKRIASVALLLLEVASLTSKASHSFW
jgi:hypothetical protein